MGANMRPKGTGRTKRRKKSVQKEKPKRPPLSYYRWGGRISSETNQGNSTRCLGIAKPMTLAVWECIDQMLLYDFGLFNPNRS